MCDPLVIAGLALSAGSAVVNSVAAGQDARARDAVLAAERIRQQGFDRETAALNLTSQDRYVDFAPQMAERGNAVGDFLATDVGADPNATTGTLMPSSDSGIVVQEQGQQQADAQAFVDQQTGALADLRSFGDLLGSISTLQGRDARMIDTIGGFKSGSQNVVPLELNEAGKAGDDARLLADILGGVGSAATGYGISGGSSNIANMFSKAPVPMPRPGGFVNRLQVT